MMTKNLCFDIGNTCTTIGLFKSGRLFQFYSINNADIPKKLLKLAQKVSKNAEKTIISSVLPSVSAKIKSFLIADGVKNVKCVSKSYNDFIKINYKKAKKLGQDRIVNAVGARNLVGGDCLIADFGTAFTFDYVSKKGVFEGGFILPGLETALESLHKKTALLPKISLAGKVRFPGNSTNSCMRGGALLGYGAMTRKLAEDFARKFRLKKYTLIVTGGHAALMKPHLKDIRNVVFDPHFTLKALNSILDCKK